MPNFTIDLTPIFQAILALLAAIITYKLIPWIKSKTNNEQQKLIESTIRILVYAAEQIYGAGNGAVKLGYVKKELEARGFTIDDAVIEATVKEMTDSILTPIEYVEEGTPEE